MVLALERKADEKKFDGDPVKVMCLSILKAALTAPLVAAPEGKTERQSVNPKPDPSPALSGSQSGATSSGVKAAESSNMSVVLASLARAEQEKKQIDAMRSFRTPAAARWHGLVKLIQRWYACRYAAELTSTAGEIAYWHARLAELWPLMIAALRDWDDTAAGGREKLASMRETWVRLLRYVRDCHSGSFTTALNVKGAAKVDTDNDPVMLCPDIAAQDGWPALYSVEDYMKNAIRLYPKLQHGIISAPRPSRSSPTHTSSEQRQS